MAEILGFLAACFLTGFIYLLLFSIEHRDRYIRLLKLFFVLVLTSALGGAIIIAVLYLRGIIF